MLRENIYDLSLDVDISSTGLNDLHSQFFSLSGKGSIFSLKYSIM